MCNDPFPNITDRTLTYSSDDLLPYIVQELLKRFVCALRDPGWNEVEPATYHQAAAVGLKLLSQLIHFPHLERRGFAVSSSVAKALRVVKKLCSLSMTKELIEVVSGLAEGKVSEHILWHTCSSIVHTCTRGCIFLRMYLSS